MVASRIPAVQATAFGRPKRRSMPYSSITLSNPATADAMVQVAKNAMDDGMPLFGICFGNQILGRALGLSTYKMRFGHRGINVPVKDHVTGTIYITAQNHGFALEGEPGKNWDTPWGPAKVTHTCLNDDTVEGVALESGMAFSVQYHPESAAGPHDAHNLFDDFMALMDRAGSTNQEGQN